MLASDMTNHTETTHAKVDLVSLAVDRAAHLARTSRHDCDPVRWSHEASHVGDLSVLALALRRN